MTQKEKARVLQVVESHSFYRIPCQHGEVAPMAGDYAIHYTKPAKLTMPKWFV